MKRSYEVSILNQKFVIKSDAEERYIQKVSDYVNKKMYDITTASKSISSLRVAILVALNIADDLFKMKDKQKQSVQLGEKKIRELLAQIETQLGSHQ
ncbi:MAG: cell division protein ZapA [Deltaproteobacteria bacterium]|nr:cell division protein ZapA [Deltaproteobacteria bacterium]